MQQRNLRRYLRHGTLTHLAVFEAVARHRSFTRAAEELSMAQPTVSVQVKKLTETLGVALFETGGRGVQMTRAGRELFGACRDIFARLGEIDARLAGLRSPAQGSLRVAVGTSARAFAARLLGSFSARFPDVEIAVPVLNRHELLGRLAAHADDFYVLSQPPEDTRFVSYPLQVTRLLVCARADHAFARRRGLRFDDIAQQAFLLREPGSGTRKLVEDLFARHGATPKVRMELGSNEAIEQAVRAGLGLAVLPDCMIRTGSASGLRALDVDGFPLVRNWYLLHESEAALSPCARLFLEHVQHPQARKALRPPVGTRTARRQ